MGASEFDALQFDFTVADDARLFSPVWVEWTGGTLVFRRPGGGTSSLFANVTLTGDPLSAIPLPAAGMMPLTAMAGFGIAKGRRKS